MSIDQVENSISRHALHNIESSEEDVHLRRRRRGLLRMYYGVSEHGGGHQEENPLDIDKAGFKPDVYMEKTLTPGIKLCGGTWCRLCICLGCEHYFMEPFHKFRKVSCMHDLAKLVITVHLLPHLPQLVHCMSEYFFPLKLGKINVFINVFPKTFLPVAIAFRSYT